MEIGHGLEQAGFELAQADGLAEAVLGEAIAGAFDGEVALAFHEGELHLAVSGVIAEEISTGGFAFDEANLLNFAGDAEVIVVGAEEARADGVDDAERFEAHFGGDAAIAHLEEPAAGFFLEGFV